MPASGSATPLRVVLDAGGFAETVVVTARRAETRLAEIPQKVEVVDSTDIERSVAADLTDVLKKNSGVDVVQYSGMLSGIGIRGFRPQFSGINKRSLLLVDGRPSGVTNLATLLLDNVDHIEVLKGAASAVYGSSAMGGVVNVITRQSRGKIGGSLRLGGASFSGSELAGRVGGDLGSRVDFDVTGNTYNQRDDIRMGNGDVRPATSYKTYDGFARVGVDLTDRWRVDGRVNSYLGRDIMTPGDLASGLNSQGSKDIEHASQDVRVTGRLAAHALTFTAFHADRRRTHDERHVDQPCSTCRTSPISRSRASSDGVGIQARDAWTLVAGEQSRCRRRLREGDERQPVVRPHRRSRSAPFSANSNKRTYGVYAENTLKLRGGRTVVAARRPRGSHHQRDGRHAAQDELRAVGSDLQRLQSQPRHQAASSSQGCAAHFAVGRAFIPAEAIMLTGFTTTDRRAAGRRSARAIPI